MRTMEDPQEKKYEGIPIEGRYIIQDFPGTVARAFRKSGLSLNGAPRQLDTETMSAVNAILSTFNGTDHAYIKLGSDQDRRRT